MVKKTNKISIYFVAFCVIIFAQSLSAQPCGERDARRMLSAFAAYTDLRMNSVKQTLEILAGTNEVKSGKWESMKDLLNVYQKSDDALTVWYALPDGTYYTAEKGLMNVKLSDRSYFPDLMDGKTIFGALVISKSTGQRSAVIAIPIQQKEKTVGGIGVSLFLDRLAEHINSILDLGSDLSFFALNRDGLTTLHRKIERQFLDPRELGSETLKNATNEMILKQSGEVTYVFDNVTKKALYRTSPLTGWKFAIAFSAIAGH
jgi:hypothetical protein